MTNTDRRVAAALFELQDFIELRTQYHKRELREEWARRSVQETDARSPSNFARVFRDLSNAAQHVIDSELIMVSERRRVAACAQQAAMNSARGTWGPVLWAGEVGGGTGGAAYNTPSREAQDDLDTRRRNAYFAHVHGVKHPEWYLSDLRLTGVWRERFGLAGKDSKRKELREELSGFTPEMYGDRAKTPL